MAQDILNPAGFYEARVIYVDLCSFYLIILCMWAFIIVPRLPGLRRLISVGLPVTEFLSLISAACFGFGHNCFSYDLTGVALSNFAAGI